MIASLVDTCDIVRPTIVETAVDDAGVPAVTTTTYTPSACRASFTSGSDDGTGYVERGASIGRIMLPAYTDVLETDRIRYPATTGLEMPILGVTRPVNYAGVEDHVLVVVEKVTR